MSTKRKSMRKVVVYLIDSSQIQINEKKVLQSLSSSQIEKAKSLKKRQDYLNSLASSYLKNLCHANIVYGKQNDDGKYTNISHSHNYTCLALSSCPIGIDLQYTKEFEKGHDFISNFANRICTSTELEMVKSPHDLCTIWTLKESLLKCLTCGIDRDLKSVPALPIGIKQYMGQTYFCKCKDIDDYVLTITCKTDENFIIEIIKQKA